MEYNIKIHRTLKNVFQNYIYEIMINNLIYSKSTYLIQFIKREEE